MAVGQPQCALWAGRWPERRQGTAGPGDSGPGLAAARTRPGEPGLPVCSQPRAPARHRNQLVLQCDESCQESPLLLLPVLPIYFYPTWKCSLAFTTTCQPAAWNNRADEGDGESEWRKQMQKQGLFGERATLKQCRPCSIIIYKYRVSSPVLSCYCRIANSPIFTESLSLVHVLPCALTYQGRWLGEMLHLIFGYVSNVYGFKWNCILEAEKIPQQKAKSPYPYIPFSWSFVLVNPFSSLRITALELSNSLPHCFLSGYSYLPFLYFVSPYFSTHPHIPHFFQSFSLPKITCDSFSYPTHAPSLPQPFGSFSPSTSITPAAFQTRSHMDPPQPPSLCNTCYSPLSPENMFTKEIS